MQKMSSMKFLKMKDDMIDIEIQKDETKMKKELLSDPTHM